MAQVVLKNIEKTFSNGHTAVDKLNLTINSGEFMVLVGPSGCAKSTTLRMIAGLEEISSGEIFIGDEFVNHVSPKDRGIAMVFQNYALYPHYNVYDNIAFSLKMSKLPKEIIKKRVEEAAKLLDLTDCLKKKPKEMSGGQRQRVAIGRAIVRQPDVFLFDEPLSNLDAKLRVHMRVQISKLHKDLKTKNKDITMIYVTHDQVEAMTMGDRICVMNFGKIMQVDTPLNLYNKPANKFVAGFIGSPAMNIEKAHVVRDKDKTHIKFGNEKLEISEEKKHFVELYAGKKIWMGIRPENISPAKEGTKNVIKGKIITIEQMGNEVYVYFKVGDKQFISRTTTELSKNLNYGMEVDFEVNMDYIHLFDFFTEKNICIES